VKKHKGAGMGRRKGGGARGKGTEYRGRRDRRRIGKRSKDRDAGTEKEGWGNRTGSGVSPTMYFAQSYLYC